MNKTNYENFKKYMNYLSVGIGVRPVGSHCLELSADYIENSFKLNGLETHREYFKFEEFTLSNVVAEIKAAEEKQIILFVAHYDSVPKAKGAMDNASGVGAVLELSRAMKQNISPNETTLKFIALAGEEVGCVGSKAYVASLSEEDQKKILCVYNFDIFISRKNEPATLVINTMGGYQKGEYVDGTDEKPFENMISRSISSALKEKSDCCGKLKKCWNARNYGHSDHQTFHENKIESANVTIRGDEENKGKLPYGYHSEKDCFCDREFDWELLEGALEVAYISAVNLTK